MIRLLAAVGMLLFALIAISAISEVYRENMIPFMESMPNVQDYEIALWTLIPVLLLISVIVVSIISLLIGGRRKGDE